MYKLANAMDVKVSHGDDDDDDEEVSCDILKIIYIKVI